MTTTQAAQAVTVISAFFDYVIESRGIVNPTLAQCEEITAHAMRNFEAISAIYTKAA